MKILESYKKMAKSMLTEHAWDRKFGEPLPTLDDVMREAEVDDKKMIPYKDEDGEAKEMPASSAKTMEKEHPAKIAYDKMADTGGEEEPKSKGLGKGDFERDFDDEEPEDSDEPFEKDGGFSTDDDEDDRGDEEPEGGEEEPSSEPVEREPQDDTTQQAADYEDFFGKDENEELRLKMDDDGASFWLHKAENLQYLKDNPEFAEKQMVDWSPEVLDYYKDNIDSEKEESITINGKQYIPIKDSVEPKKHLLRETYERIGGK